MVGNDARILCEKSGGAIDRPRRLIDQGASPEFVKRQRGVDTVRVIEVAIDQTIEQMAQLEPAAPAAMPRVSQAETSELVASKPWGVC